LGGAKVINSTHMTIEKFECVYYAKPPSDIVCKFRKEDKNI
jgi:hypothetical protein